MEYRKMTHLEHIKERPDSYIGSVVRETTDLWVYEDSRIVQKTIEWVPGMYKCIDEIIVNAMDQAVVDPTLDTIKIDVTPTEVCVYNNGRGMPVKVHEEHGVYVPELVFGHLLTSSNYDDSVQRIVGGRNGYGAKLANIFSSSFSVEVVDPERGLKYSQTFCDGMTRTNKPKISRPKTAPLKGSVSVRFSPDLKAFAVEAMGEDFVKLLHRRALDVKACVDAKVYFNGARVNLKGLESYVDLVVGPKKDVPRALSVHPAWKVCVVPSDGFRSISFVNGVYTPLGGTHVDHVISAIAKKVIEKIGTRASVRPAQVKDRLMLFLQSTIVNPTFSSQTKEACTTKASLFGSSFEDAAAVAERVANRFGIVEELINESKMKETRSLSKSDGVKSSQIRGIPNLEDAVKAGTAKSSQCTLVLTEGLSARTFAISGLSVVGRETWGVFPLKGKILNLRNASVKQIAENAEFGYIKRILGLKQGVKYDSLSQLRYGRVMILADADVDGIHIRGLCINVIQLYWPELIKLGFVCTMRTPIVKARKGPELRSFFSQKEFDDFRGSVDIGGYSCKYYKGLGTSTPQEAKDIFKSMDVVDYAWDDGADDSMKLAFAPNLTDLRKEWILRATLAGPGPEPRRTQKLTDFVNNELVQFSIADVVRSIPSVVDGLKPSQRKVLCACFKKRLHSDIKVAQLTGYVSEVMHYHHGEASMSSTIVNMAQVRAIQTHSIYTECKDSTTPTTNVILPLRFAHPSFWGLLTDIHPITASTEPRVSKK